MATLISGAIAVIIAILFLGWLAVSINSVPLWIVILLAVGMMLVDYIGEMRSGNGSGAGA